MHTFDVFWTAMNEHYPFFALHGVDWEERKRLSPKSDDISDEQLARILRRATHGLGDVHILIQMGEHGLHSPSVKPAWQTPELSCAYLWDTANSEENIQVAKTEGITVRYGLRPDGIGYIAIKEMEVRTRLGQTMAGRHLRGVCTGS